jgi:hypothetical protein
MFSRYLPDLGTYDQGLFCVKLIEAISFSVNGKINGDNQEGIWKGTVFTYRGTTGKYGWWG